MESIYEIVGMSIIWISAIISTLSLFFFVLYKALNHFGKHFKNAYILLEFAIYRKEFKEWVKDKRRHKNHKSE